MAVKKKTPKATEPSKPAPRAPDWNARWQSARENLRPLEPLPIGLALPANLRRPFDASDVSEVENLRSSWCVTQAPDDATSDERIMRMRNVTDPIECLAIVAPQIKPIVWTVDDAMNAAEAATRHAYDISPTDHTDEEIENAVADSRAQAREPFEQAGLCHPPHEDADGIALPVAIGEGNNGGFVAGEVTSETGVQFAASKQKADAIAKSTGGTVTGFD